MGVYQGELGACWREITEQRQILVSGTRAPPKWFVKLEGGSRAVASKGKSCGIQGEAVCLSILRIGQGG